MYKLATPDEVKAGLDWYANAHTEALTIANRFEIPLTTVVGVIAALSPNNKWERNITNASDLIAAYLDGEPVESVKVSTYHTMRNKAWSILDDQLQCYAEIQADYLEAGVATFFHGRALTAYEMQAITWTVWRRVHGIT